MVFFLAQEVTRDALAWSVLQPPPRRLQAIPGTPCKLRLEGADRPSSGIFFGTMRGQEMKERVAQKKNAEFKIIFMRKTIFRKEKEEGG